MRPVCTPSTGTPRLLLRGQSNPVPACSTEENMQGFNGKTDKTGGTVGRPSRPSSLLSDLTQNFLCKCRERHKEQ